MTLFYLALALPAIMFIRRFPPSLWADPRVAPASLAALMLGLYVIDCLMNGFPNIVYVTLAGGLVGIEPKELWSQSGGTTKTRASESMIARVDHDYHLGRSLKSEGRFDEAAAIWRHALASLNKLTTLYPHSSDLLQRRCDYTNDLAWLLANTPNPALQEPLESVALALTITDDNPDCATYWNTLGAAYYRAQNFQAALDALNHTIALDHGGTAFDHVFLSMVHHRLGNMEEARQWFDLAMTGMERSWAGHAELRRLCNEAETTLSAATDANPKVGAPPDRA